MEAAIDRQRIAMAMTVAAIYPIVVELVIKHLWEMDNGEQAKSSHDAGRFYRELTPNKKTSIEKIYADCCDAYEAAIGEGEKQHGEGSVAVEMATFGEALEWNKVAMRNLKYDFKLEGHSVPIGLFWSGSRMWVLPEGFPVFAVELAHWAQQNDV